MDEAFWFIVTTLGDPVLWVAGILALTVLYLAIGRGYIKSGYAKRNRVLLKKFLLIIIPVLIVSFAGSELLKLLFQVPRPCLPCPGNGCNPYCPPGFSFPSAHTSTMTAMATAIWLLLRKRRYLLVYAFPIFIAASRVELDVHTVPDVIGGFFIGLLLTLLVWRYRKMIYKWEDEIL